MEISENSRVWIYQSNRFLDQEEEKSIQSRLNRFTSEWQAHGSFLLAKGEVVNRLFIIFSVDESQELASGCSIDRSVKLLKEFESEFDITFFDRFQIAYRENEKIKCCEYEQFKENIKNHLIDPFKIRIFNNLVNTRREMLTNWEVPISQSWLAHVVQ